MFIENIDRMGQNGSRCNGHRGPARIFTDEKSPGTTQTLSPPGGWVMAWRWAWLRRAFLQSKPLTGLPPFSLIMHFRFWHPAVWPALRHTGNTLPVRLKLSPLRGDGSRHDDERDPRGPSFRANRWPVCLPFPLSCTSGFGMLQSGQHQGTPGMPCRCASNSLPSGGMDHGMTMIVIQEGLPSEQTGLRFASFSFN